MLFNSLIFVAFAIIFFLVSKIIGKNVKGRLIWLTTASFFFYGWWDWRFLFLILLSGLIDYLAALGISRYPARKKLLLILSIIGNLGSLSLFKYSGFIAENIDKLLGLQGGFSLAANIPEFFLITPVGISFYTFQSMSYTLDVYRDKLKPTKNILQFFAYLSMFPQLVAGPIVRAETMLPQMLVVNRVSKEKRWDGFQLIVRGYFKKMVIADNLAPLVMAAFSAPELNSSTMFWWGAIIAFAFQIYCDFAGYSDIARGLALWMGYDFPDNFNHPYISTSIREFWERWHISLSTWFRDYLYIPLGGNRKGKFRSYVNLWITMLVSGLWHGAAWTFVAWGAVHAFFASAERFIGWPEKIGKSAVAKFLAWLFVSIQVLVAWVFFRAENIGQAFDILKVMFSFQGTFNFGWGLDASIFISIMVLRELFAALHFDEKFKEKHPVSEMIFYAVLIAAIVFFRGEGKSIYLFPILKMKVKPNIWITLILAATLITALSFVIPKDAEKYLGELFWTRKTFAPAKYNVVLMGDSRVYRGVSPEIIESHLPGLKVLNFAYSNGGLNPTMFDAAENKLAQNDKQKIIVLGISANAITDYSAANQQYLQELNRPREEIFERNYFNPVRYWFSATSPEKLKNHFSDKKETAYYRNTYFMNGYVESDKFPVDTTEAIQYYINDYTNYKVTDEKLEVLFNQVKEWTAAGILVAGFVPPVSQPMQMLEDSLGLFDETVIKAGFENASGKWIDLEPTQYKTYDGSHLTIESAKKLSDKIGLYLKEFDR